MTNTTFTAMGQIFTIDEDGFCAELNAYVVRDQDDKLVTIPVD